MNIRPVDVFGRPMGDLNAFAGQAELLVERVQAKGLAVEMRDWENPS